jgi:hypothetical protein
VRRISRLQPKVEIKGIQPNSIHQSSIGIHRLSGLQSNPQACQFLRNSLGIKGDWLDIQRISILASSQSPTTSINLRFIGPKDAISAVYRRFRQIGDRYIEDVSKSINLPQFGVKNHQFWAF